jgi:tryptophanyl-tRNA synthetase
LDVFWRAFCEPPIINQQPSLGHQQFSMKPRVVSGMRPTGKLHLGHLVGALNNWAALQAQYDCFYFVADWHALTSDYANTSEIVANAYDMAADWIAAGLDPERSTLFVQSLVPEHAELYLLLSMTIPIPWLERVPTYKEQMEQLSEKDLSTHGFLGYPLLQTADIIIYNAHFVPVGEDQVPHLELSREIVRRFHNFYGELFVEPKPLLTTFPRLPGLDNRKMSKSYGNTIDLSDDAETVRKKVMQMYTDPKRVRADIPGTVEGNPVFMYHDAFNPDAAEVEDLKARYRAGKVGDVEVKTKLAKALNAHLEPIRARRADVLANPSGLREILHDGSRKARAIAQDTMARVRDAVRLVYR